MRALAVLALLVSGCAAVLPDTVRPEFQHLSHATQHRPFTDHPTNRGSNLIDLDLHWNLPWHVALDVSEGIDIDPRYRGTGTVFGELAGPREEFQLRIGRDIPLK